MSSVVGVRFSNFRKVYGFRSDGLGLKRGELVIVESDLGLNIGKVVNADMPVQEQEKGELKPVMRRASVDDLMQEEDNKALGAEARNYCNERIAARGLNMKLVDTGVTLDRKRIIFYFVAETRIDFRELVKDLAAKFRTRIELRQIGVRDAAQIVGGMGLCGRELCCVKFLTSFEPISIKMAKKQELVLNASKLSGVCGRLMCCLGYERGKGRAGEEPEAAAKTPEQKSPDSAEALQTPQAPYSQGAAPPQAPLAPQAPHVPEGPQVSQPAAQEIPSETESKSPEEKPLAEGAPHAEKPASGERNFKKKRFHWKKHKKK